MARGDKYKGITQFYRTFTRNIPPDNYMKYYRVVKYWARDKYGLSTAEIEMLFFLYAEGLFKRTDFTEYAQLCSWDIKRFNRLLRDGWIRVFRSAQKGECALYEIAFKGKHMVKAMYKILNGGSISENTKMFGGNDIFSDKIYRNYIKKINMEIRAKRRAK